MKRQMRMLIWSLFLRSPNFLPHANLGLRSHPGWQRLGTKKSTERKPTYRISEGVREGVHEGSFGERILDAGVIFPQQNTHKNARLEPGFGPQKSPEKVTWVLFFLFFPGNEAHQLFSGDPNWGVWVGAEKFMLNKFTVFLHLCSISGLAEDSRSSWLKVSNSGECPGCRPTPEKESKTSLGSQNR